MTRRRLPATIRAGLGLLTQLELAEALFHLLPGLQLQLLLVALELHHGHRQLPRCATASAHDHAWHGLRRGWLRWWRHRVAARLALTLKAP